MAALKEYRSLAKVAIASIVGGAAAFDPTLLTASGLAGAVATINEILDRGGKGKKHYELLVQNLTDGFQQMLRSKSLTDAEIRSILQDTQSLLLSSGLNARELIGKEPFEAADEVMSRAATNASDMPKKSRDYCRRLMVEVYEKQLEAPEGIPGVMKAVLDELGDQRTRIDSVSTSTKPEHVGEVLRKVLREELLKQSIAENAALAVPQGEPSSESTNLYPALTIEHWVRSRWPTQPTYPTWEEFQDGLVHVSETVSLEIDQLLATNGVALVTGRGACGKSVFGVGYGTRWMAQDRGNVWWLDLRDYDMNREDATTICESLSSIATPILLVIDNAHLDDSFVRYLLDQRQSRGLTSVTAFLFLARPRIESAAATQSASLERLSTATIHLVVDEDVFEGVARRLFVHVNRKSDWSIQDYRGWVDLFGADLIAFAHAVLGYLDRGREAADSLSRDDAFQYVRNRYVDGARQSPGGLEPFLRFCALASLDLSVPDAVFNEE